MTSDDRTEMLALAEAALASAVEKFTLALGVDGAAVVVPQIVHAQIQNFAGRRRVALAREPSQ